MDTGHSWDPEKKTSGTMIHGSKPEGKWDLRASRMVDDFENSRHPVFKGINSLGRGFLKKKKGKDTIHFNGEHSNIDLLFRTVHSANQLCTHGAVTKRCETQSGTDSGKKTHYESESARRKSREIDMKREELKSLVDIPKLPLALGNRMPQNVDNFESMSRGGQIEFLRTPAGFYHPVEVKLEEFLLQFVTKMTDGEGAHLCVKNAQSSEKTRIRDHMLRLMHINKLVQS